MINFCRLQRTVDQGGLAIPSLLLYHQAFGLRPLAHWTLPPELSPPWFSIENPLYEEIPSFHYISSKETQTHSIITDVGNEFLSLSFYILLNPKLNIIKKPFLWRV